MWVWDRTLALPKRRFCFEDLVLARCRVPGERCSNLPLAVSLKRLATDFFVFCMEEAFENREPSPSCKVQTCSGAPVPVAQPGRTPQ